MKKDSGFTLVELLVVIVILGILATVIYPIVNTSVNSSKQKLYDAQIENIINAARTYASDNLEILPTADGDSLEPPLTLGKLIDEGYIKNIENPKTKEPFDKNIKITITNRNGVLDYEVVD